MNHKFLIRNAGPKDFSQVMKLAKSLDSYNLPNDRTYIRELLSLSEKSFAGRVEDPVRARYLFVAENIGTQKLAGAALIVAQHGKQTMPHLYLDREEIQASSSTLGIDRARERWRLRWTLNGPTELGGLVVLPAYRGKGRRVGCLVSLARFAYMAGHRNRFRSRVLVEFMGHWENGRNSFWEQVAQPFLGMSYEKADRLSAINREFIMGLFPKEPIYTELLSEAARSEIGKMSEGAELASRILKRAGFEFLNQVCPFDAGPHYGVQTADISYIQNTQSLRLLGTGSVAKSAEAIVMSEPKRGEVRAVFSRVRRPKGGGCILPKPIADILEISEGGEVAVCLV
ncbi:MAG: arginine N-succinyltransferase [Candidatus Omnitrophica bacterium]|nr:arginine N-succinyltransferase [Candidatus Omnitrophota bacterium]